MFKILDSFQGKYIMKGFDVMKMLVYGKNCGSFVNDNGEVVEFWKLSGVKFARYVDQKDDGVNKVIGGECNKYSVLKSVFESLPDDAESYDGGLLLDVDFDDKKKIVHCDIAD